MKRLIFLAIILFGALLLGACSNNKGSFLLLNKASEPIVQVSVSICGQTIQISDIQSGANVKGSYEVTSDSHYNLRVEFQSGKEIQKDVGYVTNGMSFWHEITITDSDIQITNTKVE